MFLVSTCLYCYTVHLPTYRYTVTYIFTHLPSPCPALTSFVINVINVIEQTRTPNAIDLILRTRQRATAGSGFSDSCCVCESIPNPTPTTRQSNPSPDAEVKSFPDPTLWTWCCTTCLCIVSDGLDWIRSPAGIHGSWLAKNCHYRHRCTGSGSRSSPWCRDLCGGWVADAWLVRVGELVRNVSVYSE
jgi:hypothetical protein